MDTALAPTWQEHYLAYLKRTMILASLVGMCTYPWTILPMYFLGFPRIELLFAARAAVFLNFGLIILLLRFELISLRFSYLLGLAVLLGSAIHNFAFTSTEAPVNFALVTYVISALMCVVLVVARPVDGVGLYVAGLIGGCVVAVLHAENLWTGIFVCTGLFAISAGVIFFNTLRYLQMRETYTANKNLEDANRRLEEANLVKSQFIANFAHEVRNPLNVIHGFSEQLDGHVQIPDEARSMVRSVYNNSAHLLDFVNDTLDYSRFEIGRIEIQPTPFSLRAFAGRIEQMFGRAIADRGIDFRVATNNPGGDTVVSDPSKIRQIVINLISNSLKFTPSGEITVTIERTAEATGDRLRVTVNDTGTGIAPEEADKVFRRFEQTSSGRTLRVGTGIGLALCRDIAHEFGGSLTFTSTPGVTTAFVLDIPVQPGTREDQAETDLTSRSLPSDLLALIVDDDEDNRRLLGMILSQFGVQSIAAPNGEIAVRKARESNPDMAFLDAMMPVMSGPEAARQMRASGLRTKLVNISADSQIEDMVHEVYDATMKKPFARRDVARLLHGLFGQ